MCAKVSTLAFCCLALVLMTLVHESTARKGHKIIVTSGSKKQGCGCHKVPVPVPIPVPVHMPMHHHM